MQPKTLSPAAVQQQRIEQLNAQVERLKETLKNAEAWALLWKLAAKKFYSCFQVEVAESERWKSEHQEYLAAQERAVHYANAFMTDLPTGSQGDPIKAVRGAAFLLSAVFVMASELGVDDETDLLGMLSEALKDARFYLGDDVQRMFLAVALPTDQFEDGKQMSMVQRFSLDLLEGIYRKGETLEQEPGESNPEHGDWNGKTPTVENGN